MRDQRQPKRARRCLWVAAICLLGCFAPLLGSSASAQVKPYFLVVVDTSGSMAWCSGGSSDNSCNGQFNRCGLPANRLGDAKCALQRIVDGVGADAVFALMQFEHPCDDSCRDTADYINTGAIPTCNPNTTGGDDAYDDGQLLANFDPSGANANIREWVDGVCSGTCTGDYTRELTAGWWTPIGRSMQRAKEFLRGQFTSGFLYPTKPASETLASPLAGDSQLACRRVSVILLTDGAERCNGDAATEAAALNTGSPDGDTPTNKSIPTYVIGFGSSGDFSPTDLNAIALAGGTDAPPSTDSTRYYTATDELSLSAALADIVARSMVGEVCNGLDDDCDNKIDESLPFGQPGSAPQAQALFCDGEGKRSSAQNAQVLARGDHAGVTSTDPITERIVCGRVDDTCDNPNADDDCDGKLDEDDANLNACGQCPGAQDVCDGLDNDCDGIIDNAQGSSEAFSVCLLVCSMDVPCGSDVGECSHGWYRCVGNQLDTSVCDGQVKGSTEICDGKDNDCDGIVDDLSRACTPSWGSTGICEPGTQYCAKQGESADANGFRVDSMGNPVCVGAVTPEDREQCDELDHDCDGDALTCTQSTCVSPDPQGVGDVCGQGVGTCKGTFVCDATSMPPKLVCNATGGMDEVCDGQDNDCDGNVDEDLGPQGPCGSGVGECRPGMYECDTNLGKRVCVGAVEGSDEICDALDNDCDGKVDEGLGLGDTCGESEGLCEPGKYVCQNGSTICSGDIGPQQETCDCADNDCDGEIDEGTGDSPVCPGESVCTMCQCALPCAPTQEFIAQCPQGKAPVTEDNQCYCVGERCKDVSCGEQTIELDGVTQCAPDSTEVGSCICQNNECVFRCSGVMCSGGLVCDPTDGRCKQASCLLPQFKCPDGQHCVMLDNSFECQDDPCAVAECAANEACRDGDCVKSCGSVSCDEGQRCVDGECVNDLCASASCSMLPEVCDPGTGDCVSAGVCVITGCLGGQVCNAVSGDCKEDPCLRIKCPNGERCLSDTGQCERICATDQVYCDSECVDPGSDRRYCGASGDCAADNAGERCDDGLVCSLGQCSTSCAQDLVNCAGTCIDPQTDAEHCGASEDCSGSAAGKACSQNQTCMAGVCRSNMSPPPSGPTEGVVATGGGGCACSVGPGAAGDAPLSRGQLALGGWLLLLATLGLRRRGRQLLPRCGRVWPFVASGWLLVAGLLSGCEARAFRLDRGDADAATSSPMHDAGGLIDSGTSGNREGGMPRDGGAGGTGGTGGGAPDGQVGDGGAPQADACLDHELCNRMDDDCDGKIDEDPDLAASGIDPQTDPEHCGGCRQACAIEHAFNACQGGECVIDRDQGQQGCDVGFYDLDGDAANGCEYRCTGSAPDDTACNLVDNDCDGKIDEDIDLKTDVNNCGNCGLGCVFAHAADGASCVDGKCVLDATRCDDGFRDVDGKSGTGCEYRCPGAIASETCNALDDDCDGKVDEAIRTQDDARIGVACGSDTGECQKGVTVCQDGAPACDGQTIAGEEICDGKDNDCDGTTDDGFDLQTDKTNCGSCGHACVLSGSVADGHATLICSGGACRVGACLGDWSDANGNYEDGCEVTCMVTGEEYCDNIDNDCDGKIDAADDNLVMPDVICNGRTEGVCAGHLSDVQTLGPQCTNGMLSCNPANAGIADAEEDETRCDGLDNDCDGKVDEMIPAVGKPCFKGTGACMTQGVYVCDAMASGGYSCGAADPSTGTAEACDGKDNDCNDAVDDFDSPSPTTQIDGIEVVDVDGVLMMAYEASRPDATKTSEGGLSQKPCSASDRLPWTNVTWGEANAACCALNPNGQCSGNDKGWRLCDAATWRDACEGASGTCTWAYSDTPSVPCSHSASTTAYETVCLGAEDTSVSCTSGSRCASFSGDKLDCYSDLPNGRVYDMSGNVKEWTYDQTNTSEQATAAGQGVSLPSVYAIRGGGYTNLEVARTCAFDFSVGDETFRFPTTGFRCCYYP